MRFSVVIDIEEVLEEMVDCYGHDTLIDFVKQLDEAIEEWGFTETLYEHFKKLHDTYLEEVKENPT